MYTAFVKQAVIPTPEPAPVTGEGDIYCRGLCQWKTKRAERNVYAEILLMQAQAYKRCSVLTGQQLIMSTLRFIKDFIGNSGFKQHKRGPVCERSKLVSRNIYNVLPGEATTGE